jgi:hypothetical protein
VAILALGVVLFLLAAFSWLLHDRSAENGHHAWDASSNPPAAAEVRAGHVYHLSTRDGPYENGVSIVPALACTYSGSKGTDLVLPTTKMSDDARILHRIATFTAPESGSISVRCPDVGAVFVDDARSSAFDRAGLFVVVTTVLTVFAMVVGLAGLKRLLESRG